ncbi:uncharacterized protein LOC144432026 [Styela clava]
MTFLGSKHILTAPYRPQENSLVERLNRTVKASLRACEHPSDWFPNLGFVLLGIRSVVKEDLGFSPAELVYGSTLRLPGQFVEPQPDAKNTDPHTYVNKLKRFFRNLCSNPTRKQPSRKTYIPKDLRNCSHVFIKISRSRKGLENFYEGPFQVLKRGSKHFIVDRNSKPYECSIDNLKVAHLPTSDLWHADIEDRNLGAKSNERPASDVTVSRPRTFNFNISNNNDTISDTSTKRSNCDAEIHFTDSAHRLGPSPEMSNQQQSNRPRRLRKLPRHLSKDFILSGEFQMDI